MDITIFDDLVDQQSRLSPEELTERVRALNLFPIPDGATVDHVDYWHETDVFAELLQNKDSTSTRRRNEKWTTKP